MSRLILNIFMIFIIHNLVIGPTIVSADWRTAIMEVLQLQDLFSEFSVEFSKTALQENSNNFVCSPISVAMPLAMITYGATNQTRRELISALHIPSYYTKKWLLNEAQKVINNLNSYNDTELYVANKAFVSAKFSINPQYRELTETYFQAKCESMNFEKSSEAAEKINNWCARKTNNNIQELVKSADFDKETSLILVNAIYFKGSWKKPFSAEETTLKPFSVNAEIVKEVPMMHQKDVYCYGTIPYLNTEFINIPYKASSVSKEMNMHIILPSKHDNLENIEKNLHKLRIIDFYRYCEATIVDLYLPTFKIENKIDLRGHLIKLGINQIFKDTANFTNISEYPLKVTKIIQKAFINVNEIGSEAGAATALQMTSRMYTMTPFATTFNVNRPFIAIIATRNNILLTAKIVDPVM